MAACLVGIPSAQSERPPSGVLASRPHPTLAVGALVARSHPGGGFETSVDQALGLDLAMGGPRARGYLSARRAAGWLLDVHDWEDIERVAVEVIHSYDLPDDIDVRVMQEVLTDVRIEGRTGLALISLPRTRESLRYLSKMFELCRPAEVYEVWADEGKVWVLFDDPFLPEVLDTTNPGQAEALPSLSEVSIDFRGGAEARANASTIILDLLEGAGIRCFQTHFTANSLVAFLPATQASLAVALIDALARRITAMDAEGPG